MAERDFLYGLNGSVVIAIVLAATLVATEIGYRLGVRWRERANDHARSQVGTLQAALLGALALLLGFSFSMASARFETRQRLLVDEANAIGTAHLRAALVPEPERSALQTALREYVDVRIDFASAGADAVLAADVARRTSAAHARMWKTLPAVIEKASPPIASILVASLNEVIDLHTKRVAAFEHHVPMEITFVLLLVTACAIGLVGYGAGLAGRRNTAPTMLTAVLFTVLIFVTLDLDRPRRGYIQVSQSALTELKAQLSNPGE